MSETVKYRTVSITVYPWKHPSGREYWRFKRNDGSQVTRATLEKIKQEAKSYAMACHRGAFSLDDLDPSQIAMIKRLFDVSPTLKIIDEFIAWKSKFRPDIALRKVRADFLLSKKSTAGHYHRRNLARYLSLLDAVADERMSEITLGELDAILPEDAAPRTLHNIRQTWVTLWRWAEKKEMIPSDRRDIPSKLDLPPVVRGIPETWTPSELKILLESVRPGYLPWLAMSAFAGIRTEEIAPIKHSSKPALDWSDFHWDRKLIIVRPETSKTGRRRVIPILPALEAWLLPVAKESGRMSPRIPPSAGEGRIMSETTRLGNLVGGWRRNALRHSWLSFRSAIVGISQTAMEAGNSEAEARRSYVDAQGPDVAAEWFATLP